MAARRKKGQAAPAPQPKELEIPEEEQWRLIDQAGLLKTPVAAQGRTATVAAGDDDEHAENGSQLADEIFNAILLIIPFSFCLVLMDMLVHRQYGKVATFATLADRVVTGIPILSVFIFYTNRYKADRRLQVLLLVLSVAVGTRMIYAVNRLSWRVVIHQGPPLATIWIYTVVQLDLLHAVIGLAIVGTWTWYTNQKLIL